MSAPFGKQSVRGPAAPHPTELAPGTSVGEYRIERRVADGGMATVYAGIHPLIHKRVAIKVMRAPEHGSAEAIDRFIAEARTVNQIAHPNIVEIFAFGRLSDGRCYLVMDWLEGETLALRVRRGRLPLREGLEIFAQLVEALGAAHDKQIIHRDIKPANVFLQPVRKKHVAAKLLDFGISTLRVDEPAPDATGQRMFLGTPKYTSPEQAGGAAGDVASDVYSLGVTAFEMFVGRPPFDAPQASDLLRMHLSEVPPAPSTLWPEIPIQLERLLSQMLDKVTERRPSLAQIASRLSQLRKEADDAATGDKRSAEPTDEHALPDRRRRGWRRLGGVVAVAAIGTGAWMFATQHGAGSTPHQATSTEISAPAPPAEPAVPAEVVPPKAAPMTTEDAPPPAPVKPQLARLDVDVDVPSVIRVDGHVVARGRRAAIQVAPDVTHVVVVSSQRRGSYRDRVSIGPGGTAELAVRLAAARPSAKHRHHPPASAPPVTANSAPGPSPPSAGDRDYTLDPFSAH